LAIEKFWMLIGDWNLVIIHVVVKSFSLPILWPSKTFHSLIQFMVFFIEFSSKRIPKNDRRHLVNLNKSFCTCPTWLGSQIGPYHFDR
jgi:hypothetical protein